MTKRLAHLVMEKEDYYEESELAKDTLLDMVERQTQLMIMLKVPRYIKISQKKPPNETVAKALVNKVKNSLECMHNEIEEIRDWIPWKHWKKYNDITDIPLDEIRLECIDMLHFLLELMIGLGMSAEDIHRYYISKWEENISRQKRGY